MDLYYKLERFIENSSYPVIFIIQKPEDSRILRHWHSEIEITYVRKGRVDNYFIEGASYTVNEGEAVFVNPFEIHGVHNKKEYSYPEGVLTIVFPPPFIEKFFPEMSNFRISQSKIGAKNIPGEQYELFIDEFETLFDLVKQPNNEVNNLLITASLLKILGLYAKYLANEEANNQNQLLDEKIYQIIDYIHKNYNQRLKISMIAEKFYLSEGYLSRYFKSRMGVSILSYLDTIRSYYAIQQISDTDKTMDEIALETGFASAKSMNKVLKKLYGRTAKEFRK